jgi:hypothetical protein
MNMNVSTSMQEYRAWAHRWQSEGYQQGHHWMCRVPGGTSNLIVATHTCNFLIYNGGRVVWLAKGPTIPVAIRVAAIGTLEAAIIVLDDEGLLTVCYLGTAPPMSVLGLSEGREPDWDQVQARRKELMRLIRDKSRTAAEAPTHRQHQQHELSIRTQVLHLYHTSYAKKNKVPAVSVTY